MANLRDIVIIGAGGLGRLVRDILVQADTLRAVGFLDADTSRHGSEFDTLEVLGDIRELPGLRARGIVGAVVAVGDNSDRVELAQRVRQAGLPLVSAIHPLATISPSVVLGEHLIIGARVTISVHARVGAHCILSAGSIIDHDCRLGDGVMLHPAARLAGGVIVEQRASIGIGACIIPGRRVGRGAIVEPGAVVINDVPAESAVGGIPAQVRAAPELSMPVGAAY